MYNFYNRRSLTWVRYLLFSTNLGTCLSVLIYLHHNLIVRCMVSTWILPSCFLNTNIEIAIIELRSGSISEQYSSICFLSALRASWVVIITLIKTHLYKIQLFFFILKFLVQLFFHI